MDQPQHLQGDIRELSKHKEYISLMSFLKSLKADYEKEALAWSDINDAFRRRGKLEGINYLLEQLENFNYKPNLGNIHGLANFRSEQQPERDPYFDEQPTGPVY